MTLSSYVWSGDAWCRPAEERDELRLHSVIRTERRLKKSPGAYLIDFIGQLGQNGDAYDAVLNAVL